jgi:hypothetical protein
MNSIEGPVASKKLADDRYWDICDPICMAVAIDENCSLKSTKHTVSNFPLVTGSFSCNIKISYVIKISLNTFKRRQSNFKERILVE